MIKPKVLFLRIGSSRRTQMAEGFLPAMAGDREKERTCPVFPGAIWRLQWDLEDPSKAVTRKERRAAPHRVRADLQQRVAAFVEEHA